MSMPISRGRFTTELFRILEETFESVHGIYLDRGTSLLETLAPLTAAQASRPVSARCASVAGHTAHVLFYLEVLERAMQGEAIGRIDWEESWRTGEVTSDEWAGLQGRLRETYHRLLAMMRGWESWEGEEAVSGALAILAHTAYHIGSIRQALCVVG